MAVLTVSLYGRYVNPRAAAGRRAARPAGIYLTRTLDGSMVRRGINNLTVVVASESLEVTETVAFIYAPPKHDKIPKVPVHAKPSRDFSHLPPDIRAILELNGDPKSDEAPRDPRESKSDRPDRPLWLPGRKKDRMQHLRTLAGKRKEQLAEERSRSGQLVEHIRAGGLRGQPKETCRTEGLADQKHSKEPFEESDQA